MLYRSHQLTAFGLIKRMIILLFSVSLSIPSVQAQQKILIPMDLSQTDHLKAYGVVYWALTQGAVVDWLLNYRGGSFLLPYMEQAVLKCRLEGVAFELIDAVQAAQIYALVQSPEENMEVVRLEKAARIAVYAHPGFQPWDDAVVLALDYAGIPYDRVWDEEVLADTLYHYDWLHLHHEDFTGQYGKFYASFSNAPWYIQQVELNERMARKLGFQKVSEMKKAVVEKIRQYVASGGFMFAMCSATDTYDIAQAAINVDICDVIYDGDPPDPQAQQKLDFSRTFAFENFQLVMDPYVYEYSNIDIDAQTLLATMDTDYFTLFEFSAKYDPVPTMLTQCHVNVIRGFLGQTSAFREELIKKSVVILAKREGTDQVKYIHGNFGRGTFTWLAGHDPEDYQHAVGDPPTDLSLHKNSPGYRLILNNVLFPSAKKKKQKT